MLRGTLKGPQTTHRLKVPKSEGKAVEVIENPIGRVLL